MNFSLLNPMGMTAAFFASIFLGPWWLTVILGLFLLAVFGGALPLIAGGFIMDSVFGAPLPALGSFHLLYTLLFVTLACINWYLQKTLAD
jgi:hypothetical protein